MHLAQTYIQFEIYFKKQKAPSCVNALLLCMGESAQAGWEHEYHLTLLGLVPWVSLYSLPLCVIKIQQVASSKHNINYWRKEMSQTGKKGPE